MANKLLEPGDYDIREVKLITYAGTEADLNNLYTEINLYEDMLEPFLTGDITLAEGLNLVKNLPITGNETLRLSYVTAGKEQEKDLIEKEFFVYKVDQRPRTGLDKVQTYNLHFASPELITNKKTRISQSYNDTADAITKRVVQEYLQSDKDIKVQPAKYREHIVAANWSPIQTIKNIGQRALPANSNSPSYIFFETSNGFQFVTIESLISPDNEPVQSYIFEPSDIKSKSENEDGEPEMNKKFRNVESFTIQEYFNTLENISEGLYASELHTFDPITKKYNIETFNYKESYKDFEHIEDGSESSLMPQYKDDNGKLLSENYKAHQRFSPIHTKLQDDIPLQTPEESVLQRSSIMQQMNIQIVAKVAGDSSVSVGDVVEFAVPSSESESDKKLFDEYITGRFLLTAVRHTLKQDRYDMIIEMTKESLAQALPSAGTVT